MDYLHCLIFGILICSVLARARHHAERPPEETEQDANIENQHNKAATQTRRRSKRWHMDYGYNNYQPPHQAYYPDQYRRNYDASQADYLPQILRYLDDILASVRQPPPPPPPQPIFNIYPVHIPVPQACSCSNVGSRNNFNSSRDIFDTRNWGLAVDDIVKAASEDVDYDEDNVRPISFTPIKPKRPLSRKQPHVDHGTIQAAANESPRSTADFEPEKEDDNSSGPSLCEMYIPPCCARSTTPNEQLQCFAQKGCAKTFTGGKVCNIQNIRSILNKISSYYGPNNEND